MIEQKRKKAAALAWLIFAGLVTFVMCIHAFDVHVE